MQPTSILQRAAFLVGARVLRQWWGCIFSPSRFEFEGGVVGIQFVLPFCAKALEALIATGETEADVTRALSFLGAATSSGFKASSCAHCAGGGKWDEECEGNEEADLLSL